MCLIFETPKIINFPFETNGKLIILGVPILNHIRVHLDIYVILLCHIPTHNHGEYEIGSC